MDSRDFSQLSDFTYLSEMLSAFPQGFDFYHLGRVELQANNINDQPGSFGEILNNSADILDHSAVAFQVSGDLRFWLIVLFEKKLDFSVYSELGNILASRIATHLGNPSSRSVKHSQMERTELILSPPRQLEAARIHKVIRSSDLVIRRTYAHFYENSVIPIETWCLAASLEEIAYA